MDKSKVLHESVIFPKGEKIANDHFIGTAWLQTLVPVDSTFNCPVFNVTFEPAHGTTGTSIRAARSCFHGRQGILPGRRSQGPVTSPGGCGNDPPGGKTLARCRPDSGLTHIAISTNAQKGDAEWLEPVTDEEYSQGKIT